MESSSSARRASLAPRGGFTVVELLVVIGVLVLLISIFIPYLAKTREVDNRARCARNLANFSVLFREYAIREENAHGVPLLPSVIYDGHNRPNGYTAFTGPDDLNPFAPANATTTQTAAGHVAPNDVTASLFLLMRYGYISNGREIGLSMYVCPSSDDRADMLTDAVGRPVAAIQRSNFRSPRNLSYGYCSPFSSASGFRMNTDWLRSTFAVLADKSPGVAGPDADVTEPDYEPEPVQHPLAMRKANSRNHAQAGQNVLYGDGHVSFQRTPYCGYYDERRAPDNIYTAAAPGPTTAPSPWNPPRGYFGRKFAPSSWEDSYLVPSENDRE
jgi:prepilin-type processing-associated H-X9-DG protein